MIRRNDHLTGNTLLGAGAVHHIILVILPNFAYVRYQPNRVENSDRKNFALGRHRQRGRKRVQFRRAGDVRCKSVHHPILTGSPAQ